MMREEDRGFPRRTTPFLTPRSGPCPGPHRPKQRAVIESRPYGVCQWPGPYGQVQVTPRSLAQAFTRMDSVTNAGAAGRARSQRTTAVELPTCGVPELGHTSSPGLLRGPLV